MLGLINARVKSFGRGGRTREVQLSISAQDAKKVLYEDDVIKEIMESPLIQQRLI